MATLPATLAQTFTDDALIFAGRGLYRGFALADQSGENACLLTVYDAAAAGDTSKMIDIDGVAAGGITRAGPYYPGIAVERGLFVVCSHATTGVAYYNTEVRIADEIAALVDGTQDLTTLDLARLLATGVFG